MAAGASCGPVLVLAWFMVQHLKNSMDFIQTKHVSNVTPCSNKLMFKHFLFYLSQYSYPVESKCCTAECLNTLSSNCIKQPMTFKHVFEHQEFIHSECSNRCLNNT